MNHLVPSATHTILSLLVVVFPLALKRITKGISSHNSQLELIILFD
jgi:hypothetical protein